MNKAIPIAIGAVGAGLAGVLVWATLDQVEACCAAEPSGTAAPSQVLTVFAAASLGEVMTPLTDGFESEHPGVELRFSFGGSSDLAAQINEGAPADVFISANESQMDVVGAHVAAEPRIVATNTLTVIVPRGNPGDVAGFADLARTDVSLVLCAPQVPCGAATAALARNAGLTLAPVSEEQSVTDVLGKVASGQADAGVVYVTDAIDSGVEAIPIDGAGEVINRYPAAALAGASDAALAAAFVDYLTGEAAQAVLADAGFGAP